MTTVGTIIGGGFRLIRERPGAVAVWAVIFTVIGFATRAAMLWQFRSMGLLEGGSPGAVNPFGMLATMAPVQILNFCVWVITVLLTCAAYRLVLRPREPGFAGIRVGMDEVRVFGVGFILLIGACIVMFVAILLVMIIAFASGMFTQGPSGIPLAIMGLLILVVIGGAIFVWVRLSLSLPLTFAHHRIGIDESWSLTRGHFWTLFFAYVVIGLIVLALAIVSTLPMIEGMIAGMREMMQQAATNPEAVEQAQARQMQALFDVPLPMMIVLTVGGGIAQALILALGSGATATAARSLLLDSGEVLEDDAESTAAIFE